MKIPSRLLTVLSVFAAAAAILLTGCGGGGGGVGTTADPATLAPADAPLFVEATLRPEGELKSNIESLVKNVAGISDPGSLIIDRLNSSLADADSDAAKDFVDKAKESSDKESSYEGVDYVTSSGGTTIGVIDDFLVIAADEQTFKGAVDTSNGYSLDGNDTYSSAVSNVPDNSLGDVYVDIGGLIRQAGP